MEEEKKKPVEEETLETPIETEEEEKVTKFNAEEEVNSLKENIKSFEQRLASIEGALDKFAEEEEEKPVEEETFENEEEEDKEKVKTATYSKDIKTLLNKISNLETQIAKFSNSGMKRTSQSGVKGNSGVDTELEAYNRRKGYY